jgi:hypothetical protein
MGHWFLVYRLPNLVVVRASQNEEESPHPPWAEVRRPGWLPKETKSRDRDIKVVAG